MSVPTLTTPSPPQNSPVWEAWRRGGIGASEIPAILGLDPYMGEFELAAIKRGDQEPRPQSEAMKWGHRVQLAALQMHAERVGGKIREQHKSIVSKRYPHVFASLDGRVVGKRKGVEVKLARDRWDEVPHRVVVQTQTQMGVAELDEVDVVKVAMYAEPLVFTIERDDALIDELLPMGEEWYCRYVLGDELPRLDGSAAASRHLNGIHGAPEAQATIDQAALAARLQSVRQRAKALEAQDRDLVNAMKASMEGAYRLVGDGFTVNWKPSKQSERTDWPSVAASFRRELVEGYGANDDSLESVVGMHTTTKDGARPFRVTFEEGET